MNTVKEQEDTSPLEVGRCSLFRGSQATFSETTLPVTLPGLEIHFLMSLDLNSLFIRVSCPSLPGEDLMWPPLS